MWGHIIDTQVKKNYIIHKGKFQIFFMLHFTYDYTSAHEYVYAHTT